jgi:hypothetical protein
MLIFHPEDGDKIFLRTVGNCLLIYKALRPTTHYLNIHHIMNIKSNIEILFSICIAHGNFISNS